MTTWWGNNNDNHHKGPQNNQYGLGGDDTLISNDKGRSYFLYGGNGDDQLVGYNKDDQLYGGAGADNLYGYGGRDYLDGGKGRDYLGGFGGNDTLVGGGGQDVFFFETKPDKQNNFDRILDFDSGDDVMRLSKDDFKGIGNKGDQLAENKFESGSSVTDQKTRIFYDIDRNVVFYTPHGSDGKKIEFVKLPDGADPRSDDFFVIA